MFLKSKKATALPVPLFLLLLVFALISLFAFYTALIAPLFRLSDTALTSFDNFVDEIEKLQDGELDSKGLVLDKDTAIIGFSKSKNAFQYTFGFSSFLMNRPSSNACEGKACICLCRDGLEMGTSTGPNELICSQFECRSLSNTDFSPYQPNFFTDRDLSGDKFQNGFFILRGNKAEFADFATTGTNLIELIGNTNYEKSPRTIYFEKENGLVKVNEKSR